MHRQGLNTKNMKHTTHLTAVEPYVSQSSYFVLTIYMWPVDRIHKEFMRRMVFHHGNGIPFSVFLWGTDGWCGQHQSGHTSDLQTHPKMKKSFFFSALFFSAFFQRLHPNPPNIGKKRLKHAMSFGQSRWDGEVGCWFVNQIMVKPVKTPDIYSECPSEKWLFFTRHELFSNHIQP